MRYRILNQGIGVAESLLPEAVEDALPIEIEGAEGEIVKLVGENHVSYAKVEGGVATFKRGDLAGRVELSLVRASGTLPLGGLICVPADNVIRLYQDPTSILQRLERIERDISSLLDMQHKAEAKYDDLGKRIESLFTGYDL